MSLFLASGLSLVQQCILREDISPDVPDTSAIHYSLFNWENWLSDTELIYSEAQKALSTTSLSMTNKNMVLARDRLCWQMVEKILGCCWLLNQVVTLASCLLTMNHSGRLNEFQKEKADARHGCPVLKVAQSDRELYIKNENESNSDAVT